MLVKIKPMQKLLQWIQKNWLWVAIAGFALSRLYIFATPPTYVRYFEEYANIWYYGLPPYLMHLFEYPPATIPFISGPLLLDLAGIGQYRINFRIMMLFVDVLMFAFSLAAMRKLGYSSRTKLVNILFYLLMTIKAKDFMYENLDMLFTLSLFVPTILPLLLNRGRYVTQWLLYWFGVGIKLVNAPLGLLYFLGTKMSLVKKIALIGVTCLVIWGLPLAVYRSSLSVMLVYHKNRVIQVESFAALVIRGANLFTHSEEIFFSEHKSFDMKGPISNALLPVVNAALILSMLVLVIYILRHRDKASDPVFMMKVTLIFIFSYFLTNKVFSTPYHLWYVPLLAVYPYRSMRERLFFFVTSGVYLAVATSPLPSIEVFTGVFINTSLPVLTQIPATLLLFVGAYRLAVPVKEEGRLVAPLLQKVTEEKQREQEAATVPRSASKVTKKQVSKSLKKSKGAKNSKKGRK